MVESSAAREDQAALIAYVVYGTLVSLLVLSYLLGLLKVPYLVPLAILTIAAVKAVLVAAYYMHLRFEARFVWFIFFGGLFCIALILGFLVPDMVYYYLWGWMGHP